MACSIWKYRTFEELRKYWESIRIVWLKCFTIKKVSFSQWTDSRNTCGMHQTKYIYIYSLFQHIFTRQSWTKKTLCFNCGCPSLEVRDQLTFWKWQPAFCSHRSARAQGHFEQSPRCLKNAKKAKVLSQAVDGAFDWRFFYDLFKCIF